MGFGDFLFGDPGGVESYERLTPSQMRALNKIVTGHGIESDPIYQTGRASLMKFLGPGGLDAFQQPYLQQFNEQIVPGIAERFGGIGAGSSSGLNQALSQASRDLTTQLAGIGSQLQLNLLPQALGYAQQPQSNILSALNISPYGFQNVPGTEGAIGSLIGQLPGALAQFAFM